MKNKTNLKGALERLKLRSLSSLSSFNTPKFDYTNVEDVVAAFSVTQLLSWVMVGYRQWAKRQQKKNVPTSRLHEANKKLKSMSQRELSKLRDSLRKNNA